MVSIDVAEGEVPTAAISAEDMSLANQLRRLHLKRLDLDILKYLKVAHQELYGKLKAAVMSRGKNEEVRIK